MSFPRLPYNMTIPTSFSLHSKGIQFNTQKPSTSRFVITSHGTIFKKGKIKLMYVPTTNQLAHIFTKPLDEHKIIFPIGEL